MQAPPMLGKPHRGVWSREGAPGVRESATVREGGCHRLRVWFQSQGQKTSSLIETNHQGVFKIIKKTKPK